MRFIMTEDAWERLGTLSYRGVVGFFYTDTMGGLLTFIICGAILLFAVIGVLSVLKFLFFRRKAKEDPGKKWLRTGKF